MPREVDPSLAEPGRHTDASWARRAVIHPLIAGVLALLVGLGGEAWMAHERQWLAERERQQAADLLGQLRANIESELNATLYLTNGLIAYVVSHSTLEPPTIDAMLKVLYEQGRHVRNIGMAPGNRLTYMYPRAGNEAAIGLYYPDLPEQWPAVQRTIAAGVPMLVGPLTLRQGGIGLIYRVPVFQQPGHRYWGLVSMVINMQALFDKVGVAPRTGPLELAIRGRDGLGEAGEVFVGNPALFDDAEAVRSQVTTPGGTWQMAARPWATAASATSVGLVRWALWAVALLLGASVYAASHGIGRRLRAERALRAGEARLQAQNEHLRELVQQLDQANEDMKAVTASRTHLLAAACHDLRQPAHALGMLADVVADLAANRTVERLQHEVRQPIEGIRRCSAALSDMLNMLLDMTQLESDRYQSIQTAFPLDELVQELQLQFSPVAEAKALAFEVVHDSAQVNSDRHLLRRMLMNLVSNAIKYTDRGHVRVTVRRLAEQVSITVEDSGPGIPADKQELVFADYVRLGGPDQPEGLGIGLSIVKRAATLLDIPLSMRSAAGQGTAVELWVPLSTAPVADSEPLTMAPGRTGLIGLLENDPNILEAAVQLLTHHGYRALAARDTGELMQALADEHRTAPDLLISDFHLGIDQDGLQLIEGLRRQPAWRETVFILVTGDLDASVAARAAAAQVALAYKPLQPRRLLQLVDRLLAQRSLAA